MKRLIIFLIVLLVIPASYALTGSIGNARAIVSGVELVDGGAIISRTILVRNVNNVPVNIKLEGANDFVENEFVSLDIIDSEFRLEPSEQKNAKYFVRVTKEGSYEGKINVFFRQIDDEGPGVVLTSVLIFNVEGEGSGEIINEDDEILEDQEVVEEDGTGITGGVTIGLGGDKKESETNEKLGNINPFILVMIILVVIVIVLGIFVLLSRR